MAFKPNQSKQFQCKVGGMASLSYSSFQPKLCKTTPNSNATTCISTCSMQPSQNNIKVVINGATKEIGRAAVVAVSRARGMEVVGAVDSHLVGQDAGLSKATSVVIDFTDPSIVYENVKQAAAFGLSSVVYVPKIQLDTVSALSAFCEKASMGCLVAPTLSVGSLLLQQAAISASFHYNNVEIVESRPDPSDLPSPDATQIATNLSDLSQMYNREDISSDISARGKILGEDGIRVHSLVLPGLLLAQQFTSRVRGRFTH